MRRVVIESPFAGRGETPEERAANTAQNVRYLQACMADCLRRGEAPFASHGLYTQPGVLDDTVPAERELGIKAGFAWREAADATVVYVDLGITTGMEYGIAHAHEERMRREIWGTKAHRVEERRLGDEWDAFDVPKVRRLSLGKPGEFVMAMRSARAALSAQGVVVSAREILAEEDDEADEPIGGGR